MLSTLYSLEIVGTNSTLQSKGRMGQVSFSSTGTTTGKGDVEERKKILQLKVRDELTLMPMRRNMLLRDKRRLLDSKRRFSYSIRGSMEY